MKMFCKLAATGCVLAAAGRGFAASPTLTDLAVIQYPLTQTLVMDPSGNLYGVANGIFELSGPNHQTVRYLPQTTTASSPLTTDSAGNLYGSTEVGGAYQQGSIFELSGANHQTLTTLISFSSNDPYGSQPTVTPVVDAAGNVYGVTRPPGGVTFSVFRLSGPNRQTFSYQPLPGGTDTLGVDASGNIFTLLGGTGTYSQGSIFEITTFQASGNNVYSLTGHEGDDPIGNFTFDAAGNIYGVFETGGPGNGGSVFELSGPNHQTLTILAAFNGSNGRGPLGAVTIDAAGNVWGMTGGGGMYNDGTVYELSGPTHQTLTVVYNYNGASDDSSLEGGLTPDVQGNLYGEAGGFSANSTQIGDIFELTNTGFAVPEPASAAALGVPIALTALRRRPRRRLV